MSYHYAAPHYPNNMPSHSHAHNHHGRRRGPRMSSAQNAHRQQFAKVQRSPKETAQNPQHIAYAKDYEAARSFDFEDDETFCPFHLLTDNDVRQIFATFSAFVIMANQHHSFNLSTLPRHPTGLLCPLAHPSRLPSSTPPSRLHRLCSPRHPTSTKLRSSTTPLLSSSA